MFSPFSHSTRIAPLYALRRQDCPQVRDDRESLNGFCAGKPQDLLSLKPRRCICDVGMRRNSGIPSETWLLVLKLSIRPHKAVHASRFAVATHQTQSSRFVIYPEDYSPLAEFLTQVHPHPQNRKQLNLADEMIAHITSPSLQGQLWGASLENSSSATCCVVKDGSQASNSLFPQAICPDMNKVSASMNLYTPRGQCKERLRSPVAQGSQSLLAWACDRMYELVQIHTHMLQRHPAVKTSCKT